MNNTLQLRDIIALGFMTFALFLGAGNIIFPPSVGQAAGGELLPATLGFLLTGVGLPLIGVIGMGILGGGLPAATQDLPRAVALAIGLAIYLSIGPLFAIPRTAVVAYEMGVAPFLDSPSEWSLALYSLVYFLLVLWLALSPGKLVDRIGKWITPVLIGVIVIISIATLVAPQGPIGPTSAAYQQHAFSKAFIEGYLTMDTLAALVFGLVIITAVRAKGVQDAKRITRYTLCAGLIAALCLSLVYAALFYLGATSHGVAPDADNGGQIIALYIGQIFGPWGTLLLAIVITLACLTTAIGLVTSCAEYFVELSPRASYRHYALLTAVVSALIANLGLSQLISVSVPVLVALYPVAIVLIALSFIRNQLADPRRIYGLTLLGAFAVSLLDGLKAAGIDAAQPLFELQARLPLAEHSLGWLLPATLGLLLGLLTSRRVPLQQQAG